MTARTTSIGNGSIISGNVDQVVYLYRFYVNMD